MTPTQAATLAPAHRATNALASVRYWSRIGLEATLVLFITSALFDPADLVLGLKVELFIACWGFAALSLVLRREPTRLPVGLLLYTLTFLAIPTASIAWYYITDGSDPFEGFALFKGYLLITLGLLLYLTRVDLLPHLCAMLTLLALGILGVFAVLVVAPGLLPAVQIAGATTGIVALAERDYGSGLVMQQVYFVTSPMLAISIAYYLQRAWNTKRVARASYLLLGLISCVGMFVAGTRNNMLVAILLPLALYFLHSRNKAVGWALCSSVVMLGALAFMDEIRTLLDPTEYSNYTKLVLLRDYAELFTRPDVLLFGQGLGAYHFWTARGWEYFISELTYLEMIRNFGLFAAMVMLGLLLYPLVHAFAWQRSYAERDVVAGYAFYLLICASNPNMFSSMGMLILPIILANMYLSMRSRARVG